MTTIHEILARSVKNKPKTSNNDKNKKMGTLNQPNQNVSVNHVNGSVNQNIQNNNTNIPINNPVNLPNTNNTPNTITNTNNNQKQQVSSMMNGHSNQNNSINLENGHQSNVSDKDNKNLNNNGNTSQHLSKSQECAKINSIKNNITDQISNSMEALKNNEKLNTDNVDLKRKRI